MDGPAPMPDRRGSRSAGLTDPHGGARRALPLLVVVERGNGCRGSHFRPTTILLCLRVELTGTSAAIPRTVPRSSSGGRLERRRNRAQEGPARAIPSFKEAYVLGRDVASGIVPTVVYGCGGMEGSSPLAYQGSRKVYALLQRTSALAAALLLLASGPTHAGQREGPSLAVGAEYVRSHFAKGFF